MGAALLRSTENAKNILKALVKNIPLPITCKIRLARYIQSHAMKHRS